MPYKVNGVDIKTACAHGELTALWNVLAEDNTTIPTILEIYIEMSPCVKCTSALNNLLQPNQEVLYSFLHPCQVEQWKAAARQRRSCRPVPCLLEGMTSLS